MSHFRRRTARAFALVPALVLTVSLAACGEDSSSGSDAVETVTVEASVTPTETVPTTEPTSPPTSVAPTSSAPTEGCDTAPPAGEVDPPKTDVVYTTGSGGLAIELSDGTTDCVTFEATDSEAGSWQPGSPELLVEFGSTAAGLHLTLTDYSDNDVDDIAANEGDPFTGVQYGGFYWVDSFHTGCTVDLLAFNATSSAGTFVCGSDLVPWTGGPWDDSKTKVTIVSATGWWSTGV